MFPAYKELFIKDLSKDQPKIVITGIIINRSPDTIILDDGTGTILVGINTELPLNSFVRVFGNLLDDQNKEMQGQVIQDLSKVDKNLFNKVKSLLV